MNFIRNKLWIAKGRSAVKRILKRDLFVKIFRGRTLNEPERPLLPGFSVTCGSTFESVGLDFADLGISVKGNV